MLSLYKQLLFAMPKVYLAYKNDLTSLNEYSSLLIDKFASHSSSFFQISIGFIESVKSTPERKLMGFDIFTFNSTFRAIIETYVTFHGLFVTSKSESEKEARILLWKIEGLSSKMKLDIEDDIISFAKDRDNIQLLENEFESSEFFKSFDTKEIGKIYKKGKIHNWKFLINGNEVKEYGMLKFSKVLTQSKTIGNLYNLSSMHVHSSYYAIEQFKNIRGKLIDDKYIDSYVCQAMYLTACLIIDMRDSSVECRNAYDLIDAETQWVIQTTYDTLRSK